MLGAQEVLRRDKDFAVFYQEINKELKNYLITNQKKQNGWQMKVYAYLENLEDYASSQSLILLKDSLLDFCEELESPTKQAFNNVIGTAITGTLAWAISANGSKLKQDLLNLAAKYNPYDLEYFFEELKSNPVCALQNVPNKGFQIVKIEDWEKISLDSRILLEMTRGNAELLQKLKEKAEATQKLIHYYALRNAYIKAFPEAPNNLLTTKTNTKLKPIRF